jgi:hypothetical protein
MPVRANGMLVVRITTNGKTEQKLVPSF